MKYILSHHHYSPITSSSPSPSEIKGIPRRYLLISSGVISQSKSKPCFGIANYPPSSPSPSEIKGIPRLNLLLSSGVTNQSNSDSLYLGLELIFDAGLLHSPPGNSYTVTLSCSSNYSSLTLLLISSKSLTISSIRYFLSSLLLKNSLSSSYSDHSSSPDHTSYDPPIYYFSFIAFTYSFNHSSSSSLSSSYCIVYFY